MLFNKLLNTIERYATKNIVKETGTTRLVEALLDHQDLYLVTYENGKAVEIRNLLNGHVLTQI